MGEREDRISQDYERSGVTLDPYERMRRFVREMTQGYDQVETMRFQQFGRINVRISQLDEQIRGKRGSVDYFLDSDSPLEVNSFRVNLIEAVGWVDLLGRIANGLDNAYFGSSGMQAISAEITEFARGRE